jgi:hypothetical protein
LALIRKGKRPGLPKVPSIWHTGGAMKIFLRMPNGWSKPVGNKSKETCDIDGAKLWVGPGSQVYCDLEHDPKAVESAPEHVPKKRAEKQAR